MFAARAVMLRPASKRAPSAETMKLVEVVKV
jgi:hypothetical protein